MLIFDHEGNSVCSHIVILMFKKYSFILVLVK